MATATSLLSSFTPQISIPISRFLSLLSFPLRRRPRRLRPAAASAAAMTSSKPPMAARLKQALSQRINPPGIASFADVVANDPSLALPHLSVPDIRSVDWARLERLGFCGVVFDKDNTLTAPFSLALWPDLADSFRLCRAAFPDRIAVFSNSAGLNQYDPDGAKAKALEEAIGGIHVVRHEIKKPAGTAEDIEKYFGCPASQLVMVGDRYFTDVVYGNRNGFLTILTQPLSPAEDPFIVRQVRGLENFVINYWYQKGLKPAKHSLVSDIEQCVKAPLL